MITADQLKVRIKELAEQINKDYEGTPLTIVCTLKGAIFFMTDLARELSPGLEIDFFKASSYGDGTVSSGKVELDMQPTFELKDRNILIIEDIIDSGHTIAFLRDFIAKNHHPASVKVVTLLDKPSRRAVEVPPCEYTGFSIPDEFVIGYGLDYAQKYRNLPFIGILRFEEDI